MVGEVSGLRLHILGVPMDLGQERRGVDMGPSAIRYAGLGRRLRALGHTVIDGGNLSVPQPESEPAEPSRHPRARHLRSIAAVCREIYVRTRRCLGQDEVPIFLGGDHSIAIGTVSAMAAACNDLGVLWVDAHGDYNTPETTPSGNVHGMGLAAIVGRGPAELVDVGFPGPKVRPGNVVLVGIRELDGEERVALRESGMHVLTMHEIDEMGMAAATRWALDHLSHASRLHVSLDMDALDPDVAPGVGTPVPGGLTYREAHLLMEILAESGRVGALDIVEVNTILDNRNRTARLAVQLAASLFGKRIL